MLSVFNINWKQNHGACYGKERINLGPKMHVCLIVQDNTCVLLFLSQGQSANQCLFEIAESVIRICSQQKKPEHCPDKWIFHHDNPPAQYIKRSWLRNPLEK